VKSIDELYAFTADVDGEELEFELPEWRSAQLVKEELSWRSQGMKDAVVHRGYQAQCEKRLESETQPLKQLSSIPVNTTLGAPWQPDLDELSKIDVPGEVNYVRMAKEMCADVRGAAQELASSFTPMEFKSRERVKLQVIDDDSSDESEAEPCHTATTSAPAGHADDIGGGLDEEEELIAVPVQCSKPKVNNNRRSALREARLAAMQPAEVQPDSQQTSSEANDEDVTAREGNVCSEDMTAEFTKLAATQAGTSVDIWEEEELNAGDFTGVKPPSMARAPRVVSKKHLAEKGNRPNWDLDSSMAQLD